LILGPTLPDDAARAVHFDLAVTVFQMDTARALSQAACRSDRRARVHFKVDTGMGRIGVTPQEAAAMARELSALPGVEFEGCFTHFATADEIDLAPARAQFESFRAVLREMEQAGVRVQLRHAANSAAVLALPESHLDLVRVGIAMYGVTPGPHLAGGIRLRPAMRLCGRIVHAKRVPPETPIGYGYAYRTSRWATIATIPVGYADGYPRLAGGGGHLLIGGHRVPIAGRVAMDQMMVDAGEMPVRAGDEVELWGPGLAVDEVAKAAQTISYEVLAGLGRRVPRVYLRGGQVCAVHTLLDQNV